MSQALSKTVESSKIIYCSEVMAAFDHYKGHLSRFYTWMFGDFDANVERQKQIFLKCSLSTTTNNAVAIDLGSGSGFQSIALKQLGYNVHAVDFSAELLHELAERNSSITLHEGDLCDLSFATNRNPSVIVCMGDTITHLDSKETIKGLFTAVFDLLKLQRGTFVISYRDLSLPRNELDRFIPVKSDENRILTCFLEDESDEYVKVFDLLYERDSPTKCWQLHKSFYRKLKLPVDWMLTELQSVGFSCEVETLPSGLIVIVGKVQRLDS